MTARNLTQSLINSLAMDLPIHRCIWDILVLHQLLPQIVQFRNPLSIN